MDQIPDLTAATGLPWWHYVVALLVVVVGFVLAGFARRGSLRLLKRTPGISESLADVISRFASYLVIFLGFGLGLALLGANIQPVLAIVLIVAVIAALVLKGVADNFAAGVLLQTSHPIVVGDEITVEIPDGVVTGVVRELGSRTVVIAAYDGRIIHVPNARLTDSAIVNRPAGAPQRSDVQVRVSRAAGETSELLARIMTVTTSVAGVHSAQPPAVQTQAISPDRLTALVRFWHAAGQGATVSGTVIAALTDAFEADGRRCTATSTPGLPPTAPADPV